MFAICARSHRKPQRSLRTPCRIRVIVFASPLVVGMLATEGATTGRPRSCEANPPFPGQYLLMPSARKDHCFDGTDKRALSFCAPSVPALGPCAARPRCELNVPHTASQVRICTFGREPM